MINNNSNTSINNNDKRDCQPRQRLPFLARDGRHECGIGQPKFRLRLKGVDRFFETTLQQNGYSAIITKTGFFFLLFNSKAHIFGGYHSRRTTFNAR